MNLGDKSSLDLNCVIVIRDVRCDFRDNRIKIV